MDFDWVAVPGGFVTALTKEEHQLNRVHLAVSNAAGEVVH